MGFNSVFKGLSVFSITCLSVVRFSINELMTARK